MLGDQFIHLCKNWFVRVRAIVKIIKMHPKATRYPFTVFLIHVRDWPEARKLSDVVPKPEESDHVIRLGSEFKEAQKHILRASHMISAGGAKGSDRDFQLERFVKILRFIGENLSTLKKDFIVINDGEIASVPQPVLAAIHEAFLPEPIPDFLSVDVKNIIARAKEIEAHGLK